MFLFVRTDQGMVLISGCGHAGIINTMQYIQKSLNQSKITTAIGGFHLMRASDQQLS